MTRWARALAITVASGFNSSCIYLYDVHDVIRYSAFVNTFLIPVDILLAYGVFGWAYTIRANWPWIQFPLYNSTLFQYLFFISK
jgi:hypothetical protein